MITRRSFLAGAAGSLAGLSLAGTFNGINGIGKKIRVALIGTGWYGKSDLLRLLQVTSAETAALCDVDRDQLRQADELIRQRHPGSKPELFTDYARMLSQVRPDVVIIGTPDHWHALTCIESLKSGAHVYVQKPISIDVMEGEAMVAAARKYKRVVQVGLQRRSTPHLLEARKNILDTGLLGKIRHVEMCCYYHMRGHTGSTSIPVPTHLDYDLWVGPAPKRNYTQLPHRGWWRAYMEYSNGIMGDMCVHMFDAVRWMLNLGWPEKISSSGGIFMDKSSDSNTADTQTALFEYPELNCVWHHRTWGTSVNPDYPWAFTLYGEKGTLWCSTTRYDFYPADTTQKPIHGEVLYEREKFPEDVTEKDIELHCAPATRAHFADFFNAIASGNSPVANISEGHISTASCILANLSMKLGRPLSYDPATRTIIGDSEATGLLIRAYRDGWVHPHPDRV
ncbi:MAG: Gfo/Idh/MocA family protein [Cyclobacteriaceae bacterium]